MLHKTITGEIIPIACLEDSHLINIIKLKFKKYSSTDSRMESYLYGKDAPKMTPEIFNNIISNNYFYIIEALRRDSTRDEILKVLGTFNPVFETTSRVKPTLLLNNSILDDFEDLDENEI